MELDARLPVDENYIKIECKKTSNNLILTVIDSRDDRAMLTYLFDDSSYVSALHHAKRMAKEAWNEFCQSVDQLDEKWISKFEVELCRCMGIS